MCLTAVACGHLWFIDIPEKGVAHDWGLLIKS